MKLTPVTAHQAFALFTKLNEDCAESGENVVGFDDVMYYAQQVRDTYTHLTPKRCMKIAIEMADLAVQYGLKEGVVSFKDLSCQEDISKYGAAFGQCKEPARAVVFNLVKQTVQTMCYECAAHGVRNRVLRMIAADGIVPLDVERRSAANAIALLEVK